MANLQTLKVIRGLLRGILADPKEDRFMDTELNFILSMAQFDVARRLRKINRDWFSKEIEGSCVVGADYSIYTFPSDLLDVISAEAVMNQVDPPLTIPIRIFDSGKKNLLLSNLMFTPSNSYIIGFQIGGELHIYPAISTLNILYVQTPVEISNENDQTIIPVRFIEYILAYAKMMCAAKTQHINPAQALQEYENMYMEEIISKKTDVKGKEPDVEEKK